MGPPRRTHFNAPQTVYLPTPLLGSERSKIVMNSYL